MTGMVMEVSSTGVRRVVVAFVVAACLVALEQSFKSPASVQVQKTGHELADEIDESPAPAPSRSLRSHYHSSSSSSTHYERHGWKDVLAEVIAGFILFIMSVSVLILNESRQVKMDAMLDKAREKVKDVPSEPLNQQNDGQLIHVTGMLSTEDTIKDDCFDVVKAPEQSTKLKRKVEMYQWVEKTEENDGRTKYEYSLQWSETFHDSSSFHQRGYDNPPRMPVISKVTYSSNVKLGEFSMPLKAVGKMSQWELIKFEQEQLGSMKLSGYGPAQQRGEEIYFSYHPHEGGVQASRTNSRELQGINSGGESVGDIRIKYKFTKCCEVSVTAVQAGHSLIAMKYLQESNMPRLMTATTTDFNLVPTKEEPMEGDHLAGSDDFEDEPGIKDDFRRGIRAVLESLSSLEAFTGLLRQAPGPCGGCCCVGCVMGQIFMDASAPTELFVVKEGKKTSDENISSAAGEASKMLFLLRFFGFSLMWSALRAMFDPLSTLFRMIPFIGGILIWGIVFFTCCCACGCTTATIGFAWIAYRPLYGILLIGSVGAVWFTLGAVGSAQQPQLQTANPTATPPTMG